MNRSSLLLWSTTQPPMQKSEQAVTWFLNLIFQHKDVEGVGNLSNWSSDICCLCCPTIAFCGISTGKNELIADGILANVGIGTVPFFRSSSLATGVPSPKSIGTDPAAPGVVEWWIPWLWFRDESNVEKWLPKTFSLWSRRIPCVEWQAFLVDMYAVSLPRKNRSCFWARCSSTLTLFRKCTCVLRIFSNADAIIASSISKSGNRFVSTIDRDVISSSIDFAISTSLIQSFVTWGWAVFRQTSSLKLVFQLEIPWVQEIFQDSILQ